MTVDKMMLAVKALDPSVSVKFSEHTQQWYVETRIEVSDGCVLKGGTEHRGTPADAVAAYFDYLTAVDLDHYIVASPWGERREYRWNGHTFAETPTRVKA